MAQAYDSFAVTNLMRKRVADALIAEGLEASSSEDLYTLVDKIIAALDTAGFRLLAGDTVSAETMLSGVTAHTCDCEPVVGIIDNLETTVCVPKPSDQIITAGKYIAEDLVIKGVTSEVDENLTPENIKAGIELFGILGTHLGGVGPITLATVIFNDDETITVIDTNGVEHLLTPTYTDGQLTSVRYDDEVIPLKFVDGAITRISGTTVNNIEIV